MTTPQERAQGAKDKGNASFKTGDFPTAIGHYTAAFMADPSEPTYALNRAAAYLKLGKYEDAERDCTTVLGLSSKNVKALFRRGQARAGIGRLDEALADFSAVLRTEPANTAARDELIRVQALVKEKEKAKKARTTAGGFSTSKEGIERPAKRRVPIKIVDPSPGTPSTTTSAPTAQPSTTNTAPAVAKPIAPPAPKEVALHITDTLQAVSSRSLKPTPTPAPSHSSVPQALTAAAAALRPQTDEEVTKNEATIHTVPKIVLDETKSDNTTEKGKGKARAVPESFAQAKQERASAKPSRVGGGIFRSTGESTIFSPRGDTPPATKRTSALEEVKDSPVLFPPQSPPDVVLSREPQWTAIPPQVTGVPLQAPTTLFEFSRAWNVLRTPATKWSLLTTVPPAGLPALCKTSLEPELLASLLEVFREALGAHPVEGEDTRVRAAVRAYMDALARIPRFGTVVMLLSAREKVSARAVLDGLNMGRPGGVWAAVG